MNIATGISATRSGFELIKSVRELVRRADIDAAEVSARLLELQELMLDARNALSEAQNEKAALEARIVELTRMADFGKDFMTSHGVYWKDAYPYCPVWWDVERKPVRLSGPIRIQGGGHVEQWTRPFHMQAISLSWNVISQIKELAGTGEVG
jgi:hypothetical protein